MRNHYPFESLQQHTKIMIPIEPGVRNRVMAAVSRYRRKYPERRLIVTAYKDRKLLEVRRTW